MNDYIEFTGKTLDAAIGEACSFFGVPREKLEIEILNDAKSGIFGLVGAKRASVRARRVQLEGVDLSMGGKKGRKAAAQDDEPAQEKKKKAPERKPQAEAQTEPKPQSKPEARTESKPEPKAEARQEAGTELSEPGRTAREEAAEPQTAKNRKPRPDKNAARTPAAKTKSARAPHKERRNLRPRQPKEKIKAQSELLDLRPELDLNLPEMPLEEMDQELLRHTVIEAVTILSENIVGVTEKDYEVADGRVRVRMHTDANSGLLIGRDGQNLAALQYLVSCITSRRLNASIRVQIDAGEYRERQDDKLRELALTLAEKVRTHAKPQSTRPLSAYHRRIIHMVLQDDTTVQTHSKGDGPLKRVVIVPRRKQAQQ